MVSSISYTNILKKQDLHQMFLPWMALQGLGFWLPWFWSVQDRSWSCGPFLSQHSDYNNAHHQPDINALDAPQVEKQDGYDLVLWQQIFTFHPLFCHISQMDNCWAWMMFGLIFCDWMFSNFLVLSSKITFDCDIFLSFGIFGCHCILHDYCSIYTALVPYQILLNEVTLNQKVVHYSWLMIE